MRKLLVLAVVLLASACGVQPTPVVAAGPAPTLPNTGGSDLTLYFVDGGHVVSVTRRGTVRLSPAVALDVLLAGPTADEARRGLTTDLPAESGPVGVDSEGQVIITFRFAITTLPDTAVNQLACTAITALAQGGTSLIDSGGVLLVGTDGKIGLQPCRLF